MAKFHQSTYLFLIIGLCQILFIAGTSTAGPLEIPIAYDYDDGVEIDNRTWNADAAPLVLGRQGDGHIQDLGLRFLVPELVGLDTVYFARLRFSGRGGLVDDQIDYSVTGAMEVDSPPLSDLRRPSVLPRTKRSHQESIGESWLSGGTTQNFYYSGDLSMIINEIIRQPGWGNSQPALILCVDDITADLSGTSYVSSSENAPEKWPVTLQICRSLAETFEGQEILGRPTDRSVTVNFVSLVELEVSVEYGTGELDNSTPPLVVPARTAGEVTLTGLDPDTAYRYRLRYRRSGSQGGWQYNPEHNFHTQRPPGGSFTVTIQADAHTWESWANDEPETDHLALYEHTLANVAADRPDFHFSMGDFAMTEYSKSMQNAWDRYSGQRRYMDAALHSIPFFLVLGNHEGELGYLMAENDSAAIWAERARRTFIPNPGPSSFYSGCTDPPASGSGYRESYYAFEWGDALFVVLDPYWYTMERPFHNSIPANEGGWAWTLGQEQYNWLHETLDESGSTWKIVMLHQLVGGVTVGTAAYGRGGTESAQYSVAGRPTFEWGGENELGMDIFSVMRPGWEHGSIHDLCRNGGVDLVVFGHDHFYACQELDSIVYLTCPQPHDRTYAYGAMQDGRYTEGTLLPNAGHVRLGVAPENLTIEYVRSYLPGEGTNLFVADRHVLGELSTGVSGETVSPTTAYRLRVSPNPVSRQTAIALSLAGAGSDYAKADVRVYDVSGRLVARQLPHVDGTFLWDQRDMQRRLVSSGHYYCIASYRGATYRNRIVVVR